MTTKPTYEELEQRIEALERALADSERERTTILDLKPYHCIIQDSDNRILWANRAAYKSVDMQREDLIGHYCYEIWAKRSGPCPDCPLVKSFQTGTPQDIEKTTPDGRTWHIGGYPLKDEGGRITRIMEVAEDITKRKQAEEALRNSELQKDLILNAAAEMVAYYDTDLRVKWANRAAADSVGMSPQNLIGLHCYEIWSQHDAPCPDCPVLKARDTKLTQQCERQTPDGQHWLLRGYPVFDETGEVMGLVEFGLNVTERKRAQKALRDKERRMQEFFDRAPVGIFQSTPEGKYRNLNARFAEMLGYAPDELTREVSNIADLYVDSAQREEVKRRLAEDDGLDDFHIQLRRKDGRNMWMSIYVQTRRDEEGNIQFYDGFTLDITDRKRAETARRASEEKYRILIENASDAIFVAQDEIIKFPNPRTVEITGHSPQELANFPFVQLIHPDDRDMVLDRHRKRISGATDLPETYSFRIMTKDGKELSMQLNTVSVDWEGRPATLNFLRDITAQKKLESQLHQAQKMQAIGTLAGGIAHDFNNILTPVIIQTELALLNAPDDGALRNCLQEVLEAGHRAKSLVKQILTFSRQVETEQVALNIAPVVKEALKLLRATLPSTIKIEQDIQAEPGAVLADPTQIHQVLMNLCTNAAHAMRNEAGILKVSVATSEIPSGGNDHPPNSAPGKYVRLSVGDTGHGIDPTLTGHIFDPFFTTKERTEGTGMGLSVVHGIVTNLGGIIDIDTEVGTGTTFHLFFPQTKQVSPRLHEPAGTLPRGKEHVLVVDDEKPMIDSLTAMLRHLGYQVTSSTSSLEALETFRVQPEHFDLVITDQTMPNIRGDELAEKLIGIKPDIPIILCTGFSELVSEERGKALGIREFVMKPIIMKEMATTIRRAIESGGDDRTGANLRHEHR